ncbi:hypothetical protein T440DRAFT_514824 [Plenodomus tracheiphilus IPT5]|uniref:C2H2-type domain-containing protein n=1 Tax=Plenodomus tracheiphilus IPT5 TaxID=1408161 RepID=A0A6A7BI74_9PLEO|nr:hypothetical protein T440DRAFT_514824 [Plenodomus tracheiphilus IPT5]
MHYDFAEPVSSYSNPDWLVEGHPFEEPPPLWTQQQSEKLAEIPSIEHLDLVVPTANLSPDAIPEKMISIPTSSGPLRQSSSAASNTKVAEIIIDGHTRKLSFRCYVKSCRGATFSRVQELKRHWCAKHGGHRIWCPYPSCDRSEKAGERSFPAARPDNLRDHIRRRHGVNHDA